MTISNQEEAGLSSHTNSDSSFSLVPPNYHRSKHTGILINNIGTETVLYRDTARQ